MRQIDFSHLSSALLVPVLVLAGIAFSYFMVWPQYVRIKDSKADLAAREATVRERRTSVESINALVADLQSKRTSLQPVEESLPRTPDIPELLANLEFLARQSGLIVENISIQLAQDVLGPDGLPRQTENDLGIIQVDFSVSGQYPQLRALILNMEANLRLLDIQAINFGAVNDETQTQSYSVRLQAYYQK